MKKLLEKKLSRREFVKFSLVTFFALISNNWLSRLAFSQSAKGETNARKKKNIKGQHDLVVAKGEDPGAITRQAIEALGGMDKFVKKGDIVVIKPNMAWDRAPEYAANTNPLVVAALVELCFEAGAKRINVFDRSCNSAQRCYDSSGIKKAALEKGAKVYFVDDWNFVDAKFGYDSPMQGWPIYRDAIECDTFINVPILKHHALAELTISMKNLMGVCGGDRGRMHTDIGRRLLDLTDFISPDLTVIDAYRILDANGPSGGDIKDVRLLKTIIAGTDPTLADVYACKLAGREPLDVPNIAEAAHRGFGSLDIDSADILKLNT
ncbi:DUF362 domain-containing protein [Candidatus Omnitrophota bacterium]